MADHSEDSDRAAALFDEALPIWERLGDEVARARSLDAAASVARRRGDLDRALALGEQSLALRRRFGDRNGVAVSLGNLGWTMLERGEERRAATFFCEALPLQLEAGNRRGLAGCLTGLAKLFAGQGREDVAARLLSTADGLDRTDGAVRTPARQRRHEQLVADVAAAITSEAFAAAWAAGRALSLRAGRRRGHRPRRRDGRKCEPRSHRFQREACRARNEVCWSRVGIRVVLLNASWTGSYEDACSPSARMWRAMTTFWISLAPS